MLLNSDGSMLDRITASLFTQRRWGLQSSFLKIKSYQQSQNFTMPIQKAPIRSSIFNSDFTM